MFRAEGWIYLAVVLDACSRKVVGWTVALPWKLLCPAPRSRAS